MAKVKIKSKNDSKKLNSPFKNYWNRTNYIILGSGIVVLIFGFILMAQSPWNNPISLSYSPIVLLIGYIIIFPLSILKSKSSSKPDVSSKN